MVLNVLLVIFDIEFFMFVTLSLGFFDRGIYLGTAVFCSTQFSRNEFVRLIVQGCLELVQFFYNCW